MRPIVGSLANQIRTLLQRMQMRGYRPWKILLNQGLNEALFMEIRGTHYGRMDYIRGDETSTFKGFPIKIDNSVREPLILIQPEFRSSPLEEGRSTSEEYLWRRKKQLAN